MTIGPRLRLLIYVSLMSFIVPIAPQRQQLQGAKHSHSTVLWQAFATQQLLPLWGNGRYKKLRGWNAGWIWTAQYSTPTWPMDTCTYSTRRKRCSLLHLWITRAKGLSLKRRHAFTKRWSSPLASATPMRNLSMYP